MKTMRLISAVLLATVMIFSFNACDDGDDDNNSDLSKFIVGTWEVIAWESNESYDAEEEIGGFYTFKKDGFVDMYEEIDFAKWHILKKGDTFDGVVLKNDAIILDWLEDDDSGAMLIKERTSNTIKFSVFDFERHNDPDIYSRGTLKKIK